MALTQVEKIEKYIDTFGEITQRDALGLGIYRLASRIHDMRKDGAKIKVESRKVKNVDGTESVIAVYSWDKKEDEFWYFTFGCGQKHAGKYVKIRGTFNGAREKMISKYGKEWGFQYSASKWEEMENNPNRCYKLETELEVIL